MLTMEPFGQVWNEYPNELTEFQSFKYVNRAIIHILSRLNSRQAYNLSQIEIDSLILAMFILNRAQNEIAYRSKMC